MLLSYGFDYHIPTNINRDAITNEFESFFRSLLRDISNMPENEITKLRIRVRNIST